MTDAAIIDGVIEREAGFSEHPSDRGSFTKYGITAKTLGAWRKLGRQATRGEVLALDLSEAKDIYRHVYITAPGFDAITFGPLRAQVIDDGVLSGVHAATVTLQEALGVAADGVLGERTRAALASCDPVVVHVRVMKGRLMRYASIVRKDRTQGDFIRGWVKRALGFLGDDGRPCA